MFAVRQKLTNALLSSYPGLEFFESKSGSISERFFLGCDLSPRAVVVTSIADGVTALLATDALSTGTGFLCDVLGSDTDETGSWYGLAHAFPSSTAPGREAEGCGELSLGVGLVTKTAGTCDLSSVSSLPVGGPVDGSDCSERWWWAGDVCVWITFCFAFFRFLFRVVSATSSSYGTTCPDLRHRTRSHHNAQCNAEIVSSRDQTKTCYIIFWHPVFPGIRAVRCPCSTPTTGAYNLKVLGTEMQFVHI